MCVSFPDPANSNPEPNPGPSPNCNRNLSPNPNLSPNSNPTPNSTLPNLSPNPKPNLRAVAINAEDTHLLGLAGRASEWRLAAEELDHYMLMHMITSRR